LLIFHGSVATRARHAAKRYHPGEAGVGASFACAPGAERGSFEALDLAWGCVKLSVRFLSHASATEYTGIGIFTPLIFHGSVATRARHAAKRHHPGEAGVGASFACAPGAERGSFAVLDFSRGYAKFRSEILSPAYLSRYRLKFNASSSSPA
jgi:hypothetical protein